METVVPTANELLASASRFAHGALDSHHALDYERTAIFAGTALEHITKACLVRRHPALLVELKPDGSWKSLLFLLTDGEVKAENTKIRTVGLSIALERARDLFTSHANKEDLRDLIDLRNGVIHIAGRPPIEERLMIAFARQIDASLVDLKVERKVFWGTHLGVIEAILSTESNRVRKLVALRIEQCRLNFEQLTRMFPAEIKLLIMKGVLRSRFGAEVSLCPACGSNGVAYGAHELETDYEYDDQGTIYSGDEWVTFQPKIFECDICGLRLSTVEELTEAGIDTSPRVSNFSMAEVLDHQHDWEDMG